jgi:acyl dehydratase
MPLNSEGVGHEVGPTDHHHDWNDVVLYALSVGAKADELDILLETRGPTVLPTWAVIPTFEPVFEALAALGGDFGDVLHGGQSIRIHKPIPSSGTLRTTARCTGLYDRRKFAQTTATTQTVDADGELIFETEWTVLYSGQGGWGGPLAPKGPDKNTPEGDPTWVYEQTTLPTQALVYRLNGDLNPLHADPEHARKYGFDDPILHGLCTFGHAGLALIRTVCGGDPTRLRSMTCLFRKPVTPGDTLTTRVWDLGDGDIRFQTHVVERGDAVITAGHVEVAP